MKVFLSILAHLAHLAYSFFLISKQINKCFDLGMQIQESISESIAGHHGKLPRPFQVLSDFTHQNKH